jgi:hypothetical protein
MPRARKATVASESGEESPEAVVTDSSAAQDVETAWNGPAGTASVEDGDIESAKSTRTLSEHHKRALAEGREQGRTVRRYLEALERNRPSRGRPRTIESIRRQLGDLDAKLKASDPLTRLQLAQQRRDLEVELGQKDSGDELASFEKEFIAIAADFSRRKGISYSSWRDAGVTPSVLRAAGISRTRR